MRRLSGTQFLFSFVWHSRRFLDAWEKVDEAAPSRVRTIRQFLHVGERMLAERRKVLTEFQEGGADLEGEETEPARAALRDILTEIPEMSRKYAVAVAEEEAHRVALFAMAEAIKTAKLILSEQSKAHERRMELDNLP